MFVHYRTKGFILKKKDRGEADRIFTVFTQDFGKLELLARAERKIKSKLRSGLELFYLSDIEFIQGKAQKTITDAILLNDCKKVKNNLVKLSICHRIADSLDELVKFGEHDEKLWELLSDVFGRINAKDQKVVTLGLNFYYFLWNLFAALGYGPNLQACFNCGQKVGAEGIFFSSRDGGLVCVNCRYPSISGIEAAESAVKIIRIILQKDWPLLAKLKVGRDDLQAIKNFSDYYFLWQKTENTGR